MTDWSERIPAAIAEAEKLLEGYEIMVVPPHARGNDTRLTVGLTAGELALAKDLWAHYSEVEHDPDLDYFLPREAPSLIAFAEKIERLSHD